MNEEELHEYCDKCDRADRYPFHHPLQCPIEKQRKINIEDDILKKLEEEWNARIATKK